MSGARVTRSTDRKYPNQESPKILNRKAVNQQNAPQSGSWTERGGVPGLSVYQPFTPPDGRLGVSTSCIS